MSSQASRIIGDVNKSAYLPAKAPPTADPARLNGLNSGSEVILGLQTAAFCRLALRRGRGADAVFVALGDLPAIRLSLTRTPIRQRLLGCICIGSYIRTNRTWGCAPEALCTY